MKPFSTYPEDRGRLIALCAQIESSTLVDDTAVAADNLASLVRAILEDEAIAANAAEASGGPAFPQGLAVGSVAKMEGGLTKLEQFAGQALSGLCANPGGPFQANSMQGWGMCNSDEHTVARTACDLAAALIAELAERAKAVQP